MAKGRGRGRHYSKAVRGAGAGVKAPGNLALAARSGGAEVQPWGLADAVNAIAARAGLSNPMPRSALDQVPFGPNWALPPQPLDPARPDSGRPEPRVFEYPVAFNIPGNGNRPVPWATLYAASTNIDIVRRCIEIRKRHLRGMEWGWSVTEEAIAEALLSEPGAGREDVETKLREQYLPEIRRATEFWRKPWRANGLSFGQWLNGWMDQHLVLDGVAIYPRTTYGGDVTDLEIIDASTIKLLLDNRGARPEHPFPAFQQELYGFPRGEFTVSVDPETGMMHGGYQSDQLYYHREGFRPQTPYGFSAVEQSLISAKLYLKRQGWMLAEYDDGSTPLMWLVPSPTAEMWSQMTADQRRRWEQSLNDEMTGNTAGRHRVKVTPPGFQPIAMPSVEERYKSEYDLHLIKMLAGFFNVTVAELGLTEPKGLGSSGYHEGQEAVEGRVGQRPDTVMVAESINDLSHDFLRVPRAIEFKFIDPQADDQKVEDEIWAARRARGTVTLNDDRRRIGMAPYTFAEADEPMLLAGDKATPLDGIKAVLQMAQQAQQASLEASNAMLDADGEKADLEAEELEGASAEKALELSSYRRWARKRGGRAGRMFICKALDPSDFPGGDVPADVDFEHWEWVPDGIDIDKAANDNWRTLARDGRGRWLPRGRMRADAFGPAAPGKEVLAGLQRQARAGRAGVTAAELAEAQASFDQQAGPGPRGEARRRLMESAGITPESIARERRAQREQAERAKTEREQAGRDMLRAHAARLDPADIEAGRAAHQRRAEELSGKLGGELTDAQRAEIDAKWADPEQQAVLVANDRADRARQASKNRADAAVARMLREAEAKYGEDRANWPDGKLGMAAREGDERARAVLDAQRPEAERRRLQRYEEYNQAGFTPTSSEPTAAQLAEEDRQAELERAAALRAKIANAEERLGADRSRWTEAQRAQVEKWERQQNAVGVSTASATIDPMTTTPERRKLTSAQAMTPAGQRYGAALNEHAAATERLAHLQSLGRGVTDLPAAKERMARAESELAAATAALDAPAPSPSAPSADSARAAYAELTAANGGNPVPLVELRAKLGGTREQQDAVLRGLAGSPDVAFFPEENQKTLTEADRAAAIVVGGEPRHLLHIDKPQRSVLDTVRESSEAAARASAVIDSVPGLREGVARRQGTAAFQRHAAGLATNDPTAARAIREYRQTQREQVEDVARLATERGGSAAMASEATAGDTIHVPYARSGSELDSRVRTVDRVKRNGQVVTAEGETLSGDTPVVIASRASADDGPVTVREEGRQNNPGFALPSAPTARSVTNIDAAPAERQAGLRETARKLDERHAAFFESNRAELERDIASEREYLARTDLDAAEREQHENVLAALEALERIPRGDAAVQATKAARELIELADAQGMIVMVSHSSSSGAGGGSPYFNIQAVSPDMKTGFKATFHTFKGKNGSYGRMSSEVIKDGRSRDASLTAIRDHVTNANKPAPTVETAAPRNVDPSMKVPTADVQQGDWRWHPTEGWQKIGMIEPARPYAHRVIWGEDRETKLGTLSHGQSHIIARQADKPTLPPRSEGLKGLQRKPDEASKRGDVLVIERKDTTYYGGNSGLKNPRMSYETYEVTSVTREGKVRKVRRLTDGPDGYEQDAAQAFNHRLGYTGKTSVIPGDRIDREGLAADLRAHTYPNSTSPRHHEDLRELGNVLYGRMKPEAAPEPPPARRTPSAPSAQSVNDMMAAQMAASVAAARKPEHGTVAVADIRPGMRLVVGGRNVTVTGKPVRDGKGGWRVPAELEATGGGGTFRIGSEQNSVPLAAPKTPGANRPKAEAGADVTRSGDAALAAAPLSVEATGARGIDRPGTAALERYRGKAFTEINRELRAGDVSAANRKTVEQIDRVMGESRLTDQVEVYRGIGDVGAVFGDAARRKLTGHEWADAAPQSTTTDADIADRFLAMGGSRRDAAVIKMRVPAGVGAIEMSDARYEAELLLQRGLRMRVVSDTGPWRRGQKKPRMIEVEVIPA